MQKKVLIPWARWERIGNSAFVVSKSRLANWVSAETKGFVSWAKPKILKAGFEFDKSLYTTQVSKKAAGFELSFKITFVNDGGVTAQEFTKMIKATGLLKIGKFVN